MVGDKVTVGLQKCADEIVSEADAHFAARTPGAFLNKLYVRRILCINYL